MICSSKNSPNMYQNIFYDWYSKRIHLWDDEDGYQEFDYHKYGYVLDSDGDMVAMDGRRVKQTESWTADMEESGIMYEYDIRPEVRTLIDVYRYSDEVSKNHRIAYLDIEVAKEDEYSTPDKAENTVIAISMYDTSTREFICFLLDRDKKFDASQITDVKVVVCATEVQLLRKFVSHWRTVRPTIVTGWNVLGYDMIYLYNRIRHVLGDKEKNCLSPIHKVRHYMNKRDELVFQIAGVSILDYLDLYKLFTYKELPNYTLDAVSQYELKRGKVKYDKDIDHLYETDPVKFIEYNVEDVRLVIDLDAKLDFIAIAQGICHKGHVPYEDAYYTSRYMEGACLTETKKRNIVATKSSYSGGGMARGAFVKLPKPGRYNWVYDLDLTSLYPSNIMSLNISPETKWGKVINWDSMKFVNETHPDYDAVMFSVDGVDELEIPADKFRGFLKDVGLSVSANGVLYKLDTVGLIPRLLEMWFAERKEYRKKAEEAHEQGDMATYQYYHRKQHIQKILLNSLYGVLLLPSFRFYDKDNGEAVTLTGQQLIHYTTKMANHFYNSEIGTEDIDYCLYTDTDSVFYEAMPLVQHWYPNHTEEEIPEMAITVANRVQDFINSAYEIYAEEFHNVSSHKWFIKQELISRRAFWGNAKKRYAMWIVRDGKKVVSTPDIKGFDSVRSNFPKLFRVFMEQVIIDILNDATPASLNDKVIQFKGGLSQYPITEIMNPTSVKELGKYAVGARGQFKKGTPIHVKSAMNYNRLLDDLKLRGVPKIVNHDKILWTYLYDNPYTFDTIALRGYDDPIEIIEFVSRYINRDKLFDHAMENKLQSIWDDLGWGNVVMNKNFANAFTFE